MNPAKQQATDAKILAAKVASLHAPPPSRAHAFRKPAFHHVKSNEGMRLLRVSAAQERAKKFLTK